ncbi:hypothetical protein PG984_016584 [Apiospora sp. TS-2023a]
MLSPLVLIPAFLGTAVYAIATTPIPSTFSTSTTTLSPSSPSSSSSCITASATTSSAEASATTEAPPLVEGRDLPPFNPFSIPPIPDFVVPSHTPVPRPSCPKYVCYVECRIGLVTSACKDCCDKLTKPKAEKGEERL